MGCAASTRPSLASRMTTVSPAQVLPDTFDPASPWRLSPRVGLRPEPFGALAYHFDTRRLVFLKAVELVDVVNALADHPDVSTAIEAVVGPGDAVRNRYLQALASLADSAIIEPRSEPRIDHRIPTP